MANLTDFLKSLNNTKINIIREDISLEKDYIPFVINRCLSYHTDTIMYANEMNQRSVLDKAMQYDYFLAALRPRNRFARWLRPEVIKNLELVKEYYGFSNSKAKEALKILSDQQLEIIKARLFKGGIDRRKQK